MTQPNGKIVDGRQWCKSCGKENDPDAYGCWNCLEPLRLNSSPIPPPSPGRKDDADKPRYDLIPPEALDLIARVMTHGAQKYGVDNWQLVPDFRRRYFSAAMRHLWAYWNGEELDSGAEGSGLPHLAHAACCVMFLLSEKEEQP